MRGLLEELCIWPILPREGHLSRRVKERERLWWLWVSGGLPSPKGFLPAAAAASLFFFKAFMERGRERKLLCCPPAHPEFSAAGGLVGCSYRPGTDLQGRAASIPPQPAG